jgi:hypothetical protein
MRIGKRFRFAFVLASWLVSMPASIAAAPKPAPPSPSLDALASALRDLLRHSLPQTLYEGSFNWGHTRVVPYAVHWHGLRPEVIKGPRNDGVWRKVRLTGRDLDHTLVVRLADLKYIEKEKMTFRSLLSFQAGIEMEQQVWESGVRLYSGSTRARMHVYLLMNCESTIRLESSKSFIPDIIVRLRVVKAELTYDDLVVEHIAGIGGTGAKLLGDALHDIVKQARPALERELLAKASAAIVQNGDTREIRLGISSLMGSNGK